MRLCPRVFLRRNVRWLPMGWLAGPNPTFDLSMLDISVAVFPNGIVAEASTKSTEQERAR
jgi:hypothetical protein